MLESTKENFPPLFLTVHYTKAIVYVVYATSARPQVQGCQSPLRPRIRLLST